MKKNIGSIDKLARLAFAIFIIAIYYSGIIIGPAGIIALFFALILTITSLVQYCPIYNIIGIKTNKYS